MHKYGVDVSCCIGSALALMGVLTAAHAEQDSKRAARVARGAITETTYTSRSGVYSVSIVPDPPSATSASLLHGSKSALYRFSENRKELWSRTIPYALRGVVVTNKGSIAGVGYTKRHGAVSGNGVGKPEHYFHIVIIDREGNEILHDERERPRLGHRGPGPPFATNVLVNENTEHLFVSVEEISSDYSVLWIFSLRHGELLWRYDPEDKWTRGRLPDFAGSLIIWDMWRLEGTPLVLIHSMSIQIGRDRMKDRSIGAYFTLIDAAVGTEVWSLALPDDYTALERQVGSDRSMKWRQRNLGAYLEENPAILPCSQPMHFSLRSFVENKRITYSIVADEDSWVVSEVGRTDYKAE